MKSCHPIHTHADVGSSSRIYVRLILATLLTLFATTSQAYAGWSTVHCADGAEMCCWVEDGVESNCHEGACHTLQGNSGVDKIEEIETREEPDANESREDHQAHSKRETSADTDREQERQLIEVESLDDELFCIDLRTMRVKNGPCPEVAAAADQQRAIRRRSESHHKARMERISDDDDEARVNDADEASDE